MEVQVGPNDQVAGSSPVGFTIFVVHWCNGSTEDLLIDMSMILNPLVQVRNLDGQPNNFRESVNLRWSS